jgi:hypothetical protein
MDAQNTKKPITTADMQIETDARVKHLYETSKWDHVRHKMDSIALGWDNAISMHCAGFDNAIKFLEYNPDQKETCDLYLLRRAVLVYERDTYANTMRLKRAQSMLEYAEQELARLYESEKESNRAKRSQDMLKYAEQKLVRLHESDETSKRLEKTQQKPHVQDHEHTVARIQALWCQQSVEIQILLDAIEEEWTEKMQVQRALFGKLLEKKTDKMLDPVYRKSLAEHHNQAMTQMRNSMLDAQLDAVEKAETERIVKKTTK